MGRQRLRPATRWLGTGQLVLPVGKCLETHEYRADGTSHTVSAAQETDAVYEVSARPDEKGYYVLTDTITKSNCKPDCSGQFSRLGRPLTLYLAPLRGGFLICSDPALQRCLGPMMPVAVRGKSAAGAR